MKDLGGVDDADGTGLRIGVARSRFNREATGGLLDGALAALEESGVDDVMIVEVPGAFELPLAALRLAESGCDAVVAVGAVVQGQTDHYEHIAHVASVGLQRVMLDTGVPVGFGLLTVRDVSHALERSRPGPANKGAEAARSALDTVRALRAV